MTHLTFKQKVIAGRYQTFEAFLDAYNNHNTDWRNAVAAGQKVSIEKFLGVNYSEYTQLFGNIKTAFDLYVTGHMFTTITVPHLDVMLSKFNSGSVSKELRFGQYVYNETNFEYENSYNEKDTGQAYNLLLEGIKFYSQKED